LEKKGEFEDSGFEFLRNASERELFYLNSGLTVSGARDLLIQLKNMDETAFSYYVTEFKNEFADWFEFVFKDYELSSKIRQENNYEFTIKHTFTRICELNSAKLKKFGINISLNKLIQAEDYIETRLIKGDPFNIIKQHMINSGWSSQAIDLILEEDTFFYMNFTSIQNLIEINYAQKKFEELKKNIINAITDNISIKDVSEYLRNQGWPKKVIDYVLFNVYKPKTNIAKLSWFVIKEIGDNNKTLMDVKNHLVDLGWKEYVVNNIIHKTTNLEDDLDKILSYVTSFEVDEKSRIVHFLKKNGWEDSYINQAIKSRELKKFWEEVSNSLGLENWNVLKFNCDIFKDDILKFKATSNAISLWDTLIKDYKKINLSSFMKDDDEIHMDANYIYYYPELNIQVLIDLSKKGFLNKIISGSGITFYYSTPIKPLLCEISKTKFLIPAKIIYKTCLSCNKKFPINKMSKVEIWNSNRTHKLVKYVCPQHEKIVNTLIKETRIVQ